MRPESLRVGKAGTRETLRYLKDSMGMSAGRWFSYFVSLLFFYMGAGQTVCAQYPPVRDSVRDSVCCLSAQDSALSEAVVRATEGQAACRVSIGHGGAPAECFLRGWSKDIILRLPKGKRPAPGTYLKRRYIRRHLKSFRRGASCIVSKELLDRHGGDSIGKSDNSQFVMTKAEMDSVLLISHGDLSLIERELGIPPGAWDGRILVRIDIPAPRKLRLRMPSGNEAGANALWIPGGFLPTGFKEAVIDRIPKGRYTASLIEAVRRKVSSGTVFRR